MGNVKLKRLKAAAVNADLKSFPGFQTERKWLLVYEKGEFRSYPVIKEYLQIKTLALNKKHRLATCIPPCNYYSACAYFI